MNIIICTSTRTVSARYTFSIIFRLNINLRKKGPSLNSYYAKALNEKAFAIFLQIYYSVDMYRRGFDQQWCNQTL